MRSEQKLTLFSVALFIMGCGQLRFSQNQNTLKNTASVIAPTTPNSNDPDDEPGPIYHEEWVVHLEVTVEGTASPIFGASDVGFALGFNRPVAVVKAGETSAQYQFTRKDRFDLTIYGSPNYEVTSYKINGQEVTFSTTLPCAKVDIQEKLPFGDPVISFGPFPGSLDCLLRPELNIQLTFRPIPVVLTTSYGPLARELLVSDLTRLYPVVSRLFSMDFLGMVFAMKESPYHFLNTGYMNGGFVYPDYVMEVAQKSFSFQPMPGAPFETALVDNPYRIVAGLDIIPTLSIAPLHQELTPTFKGWVIQGDGGGVQNNSGSVHIDYRHASGTSLVVAEYGCPPKKPFLNRHECTDVDPKKNITAAALQGPLPGDYYTTLVITKEGMKKGIQLPTFDPQKTYLVGPCQNTEDGRKVCYYKTRSWEPFLPVTHPGFLTYYIQQLRGLLEKYDGRVSTAMN